MKTPFKFLKLCGAIVVALLLSGTAAMCMPTEAAELVKPVVFSLSLLASFVAGSPALLFAGNVDMTDLAASLTDQALEAKTDLYMTIVDDSAYDFFTVIPDVLDEVPLTQMLMDRILQPGGKKTFDPKAALSFKNRMGKVRNAKVDLQFTPEDIETMRRSWLGIMYKSKNTLTPDNFPFSQYILDRVVKQFALDLKYAKIKGVYNAAGTAAIDVMDGLLTLVDADVTALNIPAANVFTGAAITSSNAVAQFEGVGHKPYGSQFYSKVPMIMLAAPENILNYELNFRSTFGSLPYNLGFDKKTIYGTNIELVAVEDMIGSDRLIVTQKENLIDLMDDPSNMGNIIIEKEKRNINIMMDIREGVNYAIAETIWTNDLD